MHRARFLQQQELADLVGISRRKLQVLEAGDIEVIDFRDLVNLAIALRCQLGDIIDPTWLEWKPAQRPQRRHLAASGIRSFRRSGA